MKAVTVVAHLNAAPGKDADLREALLEMVKDTRVEDGCIQYDLHESVDRPGDFVFYENWTTREALDRHSASAHIQKFRARAGELLREPASVLIYERIA